MKKITFLLAIFFLSIFNLLAEENSAAFYSTPETTVIIKNTVVNVTLLSGTVPYSGQVTDTVIFSSARNLSSTFSGDTS